MNIAVRYQSRGGNTKAVAEILAEALGTEALAINSPIQEYTGILF
ncbi:MAG: flavodoxin family protein [Lachnospiraceae bacterium]|nr:flavodoxin family protein [Lachnospiraceae bacterium]